ncbi:MAG: ribosome maturation factor RimP [SAR202 cluster bacterium]|jgi:ribosome maturation factor RimP|nr:ribosome maturation factor RimP [SAR202 cluster bacterium]|tara:strand:- start:1460 stop:1894 length:435 start_codon:yes stop_codon:yes gene_type:complete
MPLNEEISAAIRPAIEATGNYLEELTITSAGKVKILTVIVDSESHLNLDQVTAVTKAISEIIEALPALGDTPFTLEVTSPGLDRPLTKPRHWRRNLNRLVKITMSSGTLIEGRIVEVTEGTATVGSEVLSFEDIKRATLEIEFK